MPNTPAEQNQSPHAVTRKRCEELREHGHVVLRGVFSEQEITGYRPAIRDYVLAKRAHMTAVEQQMGASALNTVFSLSDAPEPVARFVTLPRLGEIAARLLDVTAVRILHFCGFFKPGGGPATYWHQDSTFIPLDTDKILSVWIPLTEVTPRMGGLVFARGSHRYGPLDPGIAVHQFPLARNGALAVGDVSVHLGWTLHASQQNSTDTMREALAVSYYPDGTEIAAGRHLPFARQLLSDYFTGLEPGDLAAGEANPVVFSAAVADSETRDRSSKETRV
jgi:ectoine hydroxylase-related dioxygenase (phytanoyl-CoA dioxygenase family)